MESKTCPLFSFLIAAKGNWRNSIYIQCGGCPYGKAAPCPGFLMVPDYDGQPVVIPAGAIQSMTGLIADKSECRAVLSRHDFESLYALWLEWHVSSPDDCALLQAASLNICHRVNKEYQGCYPKFTDGQCVFKP
ncbi:MAG: hypothetical protein LBL26_03455 [Peptococcaceae bacterium]|jgi:hypothetical protein|nr:hypothetical protein [Peptococcaceae bacterium]